MLDVLFRRVGPADLTVVQEDAAADVRITVDLGSRRRWAGVAYFPVEMLDEAVDRVSRIQTVNDLEDLVREFSDSDTWGSFQGFRNLAGF